MAAKMPRASNFNQGVKQITTCKRLGRARKYLQEFILFLQSQPGPIFGCDPRLRKVDYDEMFLMVDPEDDSRVGWDPQAWFDEKRQAGFTATEIQKLRSMFEDYWTDCGRRRRPIGEIFLKKI